MSTKYPTTSQRPVLLEARRKLKMARSAHAYVRGSTLKFYEWLDNAAGKLPDGPPIWICGDCHAGNLGPVADVKGRVSIQIRDLDQTVIGNPAHDLIRLALSLATAARGSDLPGVTTARMIEHLIDGYQQALTAAPEAETSSGPDAKVVRYSLKQARRRTWRHLAKERIEDLRPEIPLGKRFWSVTRDERREIEKLLNAVEARKLITAPKARDNEDAVEFLDAAYWIKGCSSLGLLRFAVLVGVGDDYALIDIKEAVVAAAPRSPDVRMPRDQAQRILEGARALSPALGDRMVAAQVSDRPVVMRELFPQDLKLEIDRLTSNEAVRAARSLASVVGRAHARQMDEGARAAWTRELDRRRPSTIDAPSWLWSNVVELVAAHEAAYLDHCRLYAMEAGAA